MKLTKTHERQLHEFMDVMDTNGCVKPDSWTSGSGRHITKKAIPPFVTREERRTTSNQAAIFYFNNNKKCSVVYVLDKDALFGFLFEAAHGKEF